MTDTLYDRIKELIREHKSQYIADAVERRVAIGRQFSLEEVLVYAYGDYSALTFSGPVYDLMPMPPEDLGGKLSDLSDLSAHERAELYGLIRERWEAWCKLVGGPAEAKAVNAALVQQAIWDRAVRDERPLPGEGSWVGLKVQSSKRRGRRPIGIEAMSAAERQRRYRQKVKQAEGTA